jgi:hypothetical protein
MADSVAAITQPRASTAFVSNASVQHPASITLQRATMADSVAAIVQQPTTDTVDDITLRLAGETDEFLVPLVNTDSRCQRECASPAQAATPTTDTVEDITLRPAGETDAFLVPLVNLGVLGGVANSVRTLDTATSSALQSANNNNGSFRGAANSVGTIDTATITRHNSTDAAARVQVQAQVQALSDQLYNIIIAQLQTQVQALSDRLDNMHKTGSSSNSTNNLVYNETTPIGSPPLQLHYNSNFTAIADTGASNHYCHTNAPVPQHD